MKCETNTFIGRNDVLIDKKDPVVSLGGNDSMTLIYKAVAEHLCCDLNGEAVILNMKNGKYYGVNTVGATIWAAVQKSVSFEGIQSVVMEEFDVDEAICHREIKAFLNKMAEEDLIEISNEKAS